MRARTTHLAKETHLSCSFWKTPMANSARGRLRSRRAIDKGGSFHRASSLSAAAQAEGADHWNSLALPARTGDATGRSETPRDCPLYRASDALDTPNGEQSVSGRQSGMNNLAGSCERPVPDQIPLHSCKCIGYSGEHGAYAGCAFAQAHILVGSTRQRFGQNESEVLSTYPSSFAEPSHQQEYTRRTLLPNSSRNRVPTATLVPSSNMGQSSS